MSDETLTAEERCQFINSGQTGAGSIDPWCRTHERSAICCLDAALARVEALHNNRGILLQSTEAMWMGQQKRACIAESRLAEAKALLLDAEAFISGDWQNRRAAFLSASTPAPAAPLDDPSLWPFDVPRAAPAAESEPDAGERSPDWRAGYLEGLDDAVKEIEAGERIDTKLADAVGKIETMLAQKTRIAELEAANKGLAELTLQTQTRIDQAAAELERDIKQHGLVAGAAVRALAILRGGQ